ncbi:MAG TPA: hypothetical protein VJT13_15140 [Xanthobacteraceae bacterium]|nr:hypothetical protein [Xanthobacteraceae bacterium]
MTWPSSIFAVVKRRFDFESAMLSGLSKRFRLKAAVALAALYAFCVLAPHAALALSNAAAHCLTEAPGAAHVHHAPAKAAQHVHADGVAHTHDDTSAPNQHPDADGKSHAGNCCGLFCVTALSHEAAPTLLAPPAAPLVRSGAFYHLAGCGPDRINRPPIA